MIELNIVCVGDLKEKYLTDAVEEYKRRLSAFANVSILEVKEINTGNREADILLNKKNEATFLNKHKKGHLFALEIDGKSFGSTSFANHLQNLMTNGVSAFTFFVGGSNGLDANFSNTCNEKLSFSKFTFPHQLMRVILLEQLYRAFTILNNKTYHK